MKTILLIVSLYFCVLSVSVCAGPQLAINLKSCTATADVICVGEVISVTNNGVISVSTETSTINTGSYDAELLRANIIVSRMFKGEEHGIITLECYRNIQAWVPGIAEGYYILFLRRKGDIFIPVHQPGFLVPIDSRGLHAEDDTMTEIFKATVAFKNPRLVRSSLNMLSQLMAPNEFIEYAHQLLNDYDTFVQGAAIMELINFGDTSVLDKATRYSESNYDDKELNNLARAISIKVQQIKNLGTKKPNQR